MPMVKPAWLTLIIFTFQRVWNSSNLQYVYSENLKTFPVALSQISAEGVASAGIAAAITFVIMVPPVVIFMFSQNAVIETMAHSGLKY